MRLLVAEADASLAEFLRQRFQENQFAVQLISREEEFSRVEMNGDANILLLDLNLPGIPGPDYLPQVYKRWANLPVILLSSSTAVEDRVRGLNAGADDFLVKPFAAAELVARVNAVLRRRNQPAAQIYHFEDLEIDRVTHGVRRAGRVIELSPKEYALLDFLLRNPGRPVSRAAIIEQVWQMHSESITNVVDVYINYLRRKIDAGSDRPLIRTIRGVGYQIG